MKPEGYWRCPETLSSSILQDVSGFGGVAYSLSAQQYVRQRDRREKEICWGEGWWKLYWRVRHRRQASNPESMTQRHFNRRHVSHDKMRRLLLRIGPSSCLPVLPPVSANGVKSWSPTAVEEVGEYISSMLSVYPNQPTSHVNLYRAEMLRRMIDCSGC